jgi:chromate transporter
MREKAPGRTPALHGSPHVTKPPPTLGKLTRVFLRIGNTTFGGGNPTMAALRREFVDREHWLSKEDFALAYSLARVTPGTSVIAFCAASGARILGTAGAIAGVLSETMPSALAAVLLTWGYQSWGSNPLVIAAMGGTAAAVVGMILASAWTLIRPYLTSAASAPGRALGATLLVAAAFIGSWRFGLTPVPVIGLAVLAGLLWKENPE